MRSPQNTIILTAFLWATPALAQDLICVMEDPFCTQGCSPLDIAFSIDSSQFAAPQDPNDPPRRQITTVNYGDTTFVATAIMMPGGIVGFHEDAGALGSRLMIVQSSGQARLTLQPLNTTLTGSCQQS